MPEPWRQNKKSPALKPGRGMERLRLDELN